MVIPLLTNQGLTPLLPLLPSKESPLGAQYIATQMVNKSMFLSKFQMILSLFKEFSVIEQNYVWESGRTLVEKAFSF